MLMAMSLDACIFSVEVLSVGTPTSSPSNEPSLPPTATQTPVPIILIPPSATPALIPIRDNTLSMLEIFSNVGGGELLRSVAFTPDSTVLATAGGNVEDFTIHLWDV